MGEEPTPYHCRIAKPDTFLSGDDVTLRPVRQGGRSAHQVTYLPPK